MKSGVFQDKEKTFLSVVIYVKNNEAHIQDFLLKLDEYLASRFESYEYVLINDFSSDNSADAVKQISEKINGSICMINMAWTQGKELSILAGKDIAIGDFIFEIESAQRDWDLELLDILYQKCISGFDIVAAVPAKGGSFLSFFFYRFFKLITPFKMDLSTETVRAISRRALNAVLMSKEKIRYRKLLYKLTGFPYATIRYLPAAQKAVNNRTFFESTSLAFNILTNYSNFGLQIALFLSILFLAISIAGGLYAIGSYMYLNKIMEGWTTTILFLSAAFSGIFFILTIITKYISMILIEVQDKPLYKISGIERF